MSRLASALAAMAGAANKLGCESSGTDYAVALDEARAVFVEQQQILRRLSAWNRNPNGEGSELGEICAAAELLTGQVSDDEPRHGCAQLEVVQDLIRAADGMDSIADWVGGDGHSIRYYFPNEFSVLRAALAKFGGAA